MSGSLTIIGGHSSTQGLTGIVTVSSGFTGSVVTSLQSLLVSASGAVSANAANFANLDVGGASGVQTVPAGSLGAGILDISNQNSVNATTGGAANVSVTVPAGYNTLLVQAPGNETVTGSGGDYLAVFGDQSRVNFNAAGGSGTVFAAGNDTVSMSGATNFFQGATIGGNSVNAAGGSAAITLGGGANTVQSAALQATVQSAGSDVIYTNNSAANAQINVTGNATVENFGSADTITATSGGKFIGYFNGSNGGQLEFVNSSFMSSSIIASLNPATGVISSQGSVTVSAGNAGGIYDGGTTGNNSLVGGTGAVTLFAAGLNNTMYTAGQASGTAYNLLNAFSGGNDTLVGGDGSINNTFFAGIGTESIVSYGSGGQNFFVGTLGSETISGSPVPGASNSFIFQQTVAQGGGTDVLQNFQPGEGHINLGNGIVNVIVSSFEALTGRYSGTQIDLNNGTTIKVIGVSPASFASENIAGKTYF